MCPCLPSAWRTSLTMTSNRVLDIYARLQDGTTSTTGLARRAAWPFSDERRWHGTVKDGQSLPGDGMDRPENAVGLDRISATGFRGPLFAASQKSPNRTSLRASSAMSYRAFRFPSVGRLASALSELI